jgi:methionine-rich copper-binding protein CopC
MGGTVVSRTKLLLAVTAGALCAFFWTVPAQAHNSFTGSNPKNGARIAEAPATVTLSFLATVDPASAKATVTGPDGSPAARGKLGIKGNKLTVGVRPGAAGQYTVAYRVTSPDGHPVKGTIRFTVTTAASSAATASTAPTGSGPATTAPASVAPSAVAIDRVAGEDTSTTWWPWLLGAVVLLAAAAAGTLLVRRRAAR